MGISSRFAVVGVAAILSVLPGLWPAAQARVTGATPTGPARASARPTSVCSTDQKGDLVGCPRPVSRSALPAAVRDNRVGTAPIRNLAAVVDTRTWTSSGGNTFPGADVPFGMVQWSPDTVPHRSDGGGYTHGDPRLPGYSLTHVSGPGCRPAGDIPILPLTGKLPATDPNAVTTSFTNAGEVAQAGYYSATSNGPHPIVSQFTATPHTAMGKFAFPRTPAADFLSTLAYNERRGL